MFIFTSGQKKNMDFIETIFREGARFFHETNGHVYNTALLKMLLED